MHKILIVLALTVGFTWSVVFIILPKIESKADEISKTTDLKVNSGSTVSPQSEEKEEPAEEHKIDNKEIVRKKIEAMRKRLALKGLIIEGDSYYREGQLPLALIKYLEFYKKNPSDTLIVEKLGDTYFEMKKFHSAYSYYSKIREKNDSIKEKTASALVLTTKNNIESIAKTRKEIKQLGLNEESLIYYETSLSCFLDFHACKKEFGDYFWPDGPERNPKNKKLTQIKNAINNYRNFQLDEVYLKDAYLIGTWYENGFYNLSVDLGENLLQEKVGYKPVLKIVAQSYFELGKYDESREVLGKYYEIDDEDPAVAYLLGVINTKLREYVLANIYLKKSIELGYTNSNNAKRQLIHNFYALENDESMLEEFVSLIEGEDFNENDLSLAIYYHILHEKYVQANVWAKKGKELYGDTNGNFHTYEGWILTEQGKYDEAAVILKQGLEIDKENPFILINLGYNALKRGEKGEALVYFKKVLSTSPNSEFASNASEEIKKMSQK